MELPTSISRKDNVISQSGTDWLAADGKTEVVSPEKTSSTVSSSSRPETHLRSNMADLQIIMLVPLEIQHG